MRSIRVKVRPNAREAGLDQLDDGTWVARVKSPPVDGKANRELVELLARRFDLRRAQISIKSGASGRLKTVRLDD